MIRFRLRTLIAVEIITILVLSVALGSIVFVSDISTRVREHYSRDLGILRQTFLSHRNEIVNGSVESFEQSLLGIANIYGINYYEIQYGMTGERHRLSRELSEMPKEASEKPHTCSRGEIQSILWTDEICFQNSFTWDDQGSDPLVRIRWYVPAESSDHASSALLILSSIVLLGLTLCAFHWILFKRAILAPINDAIKRFDAWVRLGESLPAKYDSVFSSSEINKLILQIDKLLAVAKDYAVVREKSIRLEASETIAHQVAHDIQSPLAAISVVEKELLELPEEKRTMLRSAANRIRDIANDLLARNSDISPISTNGEKCVEKTSPELLSAILEGMISEKRLQFRTRIGVEILLHLGTTSYGLFANIASPEFKRLISNLINNAVEAIDTGGGRVDVYLRGDGSDIHIEIVDTGKGIPEELLPRLGAKGETHGKTGGSGLGLFHAISCLKSWGGDLKIQSRPNEGTRIAIELPRSPTPVWFQEKLTIPHCSQIVVFDDDVAIHQIWKKRLQNRQSKMNGITIHNFSTPEQLKKWVRENDISKTHFLVDYEVLGFNESGLDICEELNILGCSTLVTGRFEEEDVRLRCIALGMRIVPKGLAGIVPIDFTIKRSPNAVLIDDDSLVHMTWLESAKEKGADLLTFKSAKDFLEAAATLEPNTPIYIDSNLGDGIKGEVVAKVIFELGFRNIFLASGYDKDRFAISEMPWLRDVVGKDPAI